MNPESQSVYAVDVSKVFRSSWLFVLEKSVGGLGRFRDRSLPHSARDQANLEESRAIIRPMCVIL